MDMLAQLRRYNATHAPAEDDADDLQVQVKAMEIVHKRRTQVEQRRQRQQRQKQLQESTDGGKHPSHEHIPKFFFGKKTRHQAPPPHGPSASPAVGLDNKQVVSTEETSLQRCARLFQELAYSRALHVVEDDLIPNAEASIAGVCMALAEAVRDGRSYHEQEYALNYDNFCTLGAQCVASAASSENGGSAGGGYQFRQYFTASVFLQLAGEDNTVGLDALQEYMIQHQRYLRAVVLLSKIDLEMGSGDGRFTEEVRFVSF